MAGNEKGLENVGLAALGGIVAIGMVFWGAGAISARLVGHTTVSTPSIMPQVLTGIVSNPAHPNLAWPEPDRAAVPGPFLYWLVFLVLVGGLSVVGVYLYRVFTDGIGGGSSRKNSLGGKNTQWAKKSDMKTLIVRGPEPGRLILGSVNGSLVATEQRHSVIVLGPTQSGKTTGLAVPSILEWRGPCIATSVKNDLAQDTLGWRERQGSVWVYDPTATTGLEAATWSPLDGAREWSGAKKIASWLTSASKSGGKGGLSDGDFWYSAAGKLLAPHLFAAAANGYTMADVVRWIDTQEEFEVRSLLQATGVEEAITAAEASWQREDRAKSSIYTTAEVVIEAYSEPTILNSAKTSDIRTSKFFDGGHHTLYVCAPSHEQDRLRPVFSTLLKQFIRAAYDFGKRLDPPLLIVLDEAANIAPLDDLDSIASTCSGLGIQLLTVWQDLSQINARYGDRANTVVNNHRAKIVLSGISDPTTLDYVSRLVGSEEIRQESSTIDGQGSKSRTISTQDKNLAPSDVVRRIKQNEGLLVYGALLPARLKLRPWYKSKRLTAMVKNDIPEDHNPELQAHNTAGDLASSPAYDDYQKTSPIG
jgi:type IV secretory pathway TraG/TraD family ATPase VirD4